VFNYLIRVHLPDRPGALGAVASRIGSVGGDVISIDILERVKGVVIDELGVGLAGDHLVDLLRDEVLEVDGVSIESLRPVEGALPDRHLDLLEVAAELFKQRSPKALLDHLTVRVRRSLAATFAAVLDRGASNVVASDGPAPDGVGLNALVLRALGPTEDSFEDPLDDGSGVGVARMAEAGLILVVGRSDPVLRERERQWISIIAELADHGWGNRV